MAIKNSTTLLWGLICVLALVIGLILGRQGLAGESQNNANNIPPASNFRADFPLTQVKEKTFKNEIVRLDGNEFINCTFDNVGFEFDGQAPFRFTNVHFENQAKIEIKSKNPVVSATLELMGAFMKLQNANRSFLPKLSFVGLQ
jgi:hypothetical protein